MTVAQETDAEIARLQNQLGHGFSKSQEGYELIYEGLRNDDNRKFQLGVEITDTYSEQVHDICGQLKQVYLEGR